MSPVRPDVRAFFEQYERAGQDLDDCALTSCFCDVFVSLDPNSATAVSPQALLAVLPRRKALFRSIGSDGLELADISETTHTHSSGPPGRYEWTASHLARTSRCCRHLSFAGRTERGGLRCT